MTPSLGLSWHGGHLTRHEALNVSGELYNVVAYSVDESGRDEHGADCVNWLMPERPKLIVPALVRVPRQLDFAAFRAIADEISRGLWVDTSRPRAWWLLSLQTPVRTHTWSPPPYTRLWAVPLPASSSAPRS